MVHFEVVKRRDLVGRQRWRVSLVGANGEQVVTSESYTTEYAALEAVEFVRRWGPTAPVRTKSR